MNRVTLTKTLPELTEGSGDDDFLPSSFFIITLLIMKTPTGRAQLFLFRVCVSAVD